MILSRISKQVLHSIPVLSIFVLLGIMGYTIISPNKLVNVLSLGLGESDGEVYAVDNTGSASSLIIDNGELSSNDNSNTTTEGNITYSSHTVQVIANNIEGYSLNITGPTNMTTANTSNPTTITGANNKTPANMANNTWGYAWGSTSTPNTSLSYNSFTDSDQTLASNSSATSANFTNKLVFAVKFGNTAVSGHYKANVKLNLAVTPKTVTTYSYSVTYNANGGTGTVPATQSYTTSDTSTIMYASDGSGLTKTNRILIGWSESDNSTTATYAKGGTINLNSTSPTKNLYAVWAQAPLNWNTIQNMQDMTPAICTEAPANASKTLTDSRDGKTYSVQKLTDGNCWMTNNLALNLSTIDVTSTDSDVAIAFTKGTATQITKYTDWKSSPYNVIQFATNDNDISGYNVLYGYYYSWCAVTANSCQYAAANGADAPSSICPRGWKIPKGGTIISTNTSMSQAGNDFVNLLNTDGADLTSVNTNTTVPWANRVLSTTPPSVSLGGTNWYLSGYYHRNNGGTGIGTTAYYWTRTGMGDNSAIYFMFGNETIRPDDYTGRYIGRPVRCIAYSS